MVEDKKEILSKELAKMRSEFSVNVRNKALEYEEEVTDEDFTTIFNSMVLDLIEEFVGSENRTKEFEVLMETSKILDEM